MEILADEMARVKGAADLSAFCDAQGLERRGRDKYVCPICDSGNGANHSAAFKVQGNHWHCFSCDRGGDVFDLAGVLNHTDDKGEQTRIVAEWAGLPTSRGHESANNATKAEKRPTIHKDEEKPADAPTEADGGKAENFTRFYEKAHADLMASEEALAYLHGRGITDETAARFNVGYVAGWTHPKTEKHPTKRLILPRTAQTYTARAIDPDEPTYNPEYKKQVVGTQKDLFNLEAARSAEVVVVVEGELDAMSVEQATGYVAVGIGSIGNAKRLVEKAAEVAPSAWWLVALDNDTPKEDGRNPGQEAQEEIIKGLTDKGIPCMALDGARMYGGAKDANEALTSNPETLKAAIDEAVAGRERVEAEQYAAALERLRVFDPIDVTCGLYSLDNVREPIPTGLASVDAALGGGLPSRGLVTLGAVSSVGKTTFAVQLADTLAAEGHGVLFVTIEQSAEEIVAKSISRFMAAQTRQHGQRIKASAQSLTSKNARDRWAREDTEMLEALKNACRAYDSTTRRADGTRTLRIMEATQQPTVADVRAAAEWIAKHDGQAPVIFIDYLQLLAAPEGHDRNSDKQITDSNVRALRQAARDLDTCVFVISSLNRSSYSGSVSLESFKESGAIEYGADVLLGLQPADLARDLEEETNEAKARKKAKQAMADFKASTRRECELVVLKNRNAGLPRYGVRLAYETVCNTFEETPAGRAPGRAANDNPVWI